MRSIAFINQKGGVGKTTSVLNVGAGLANMGYRVLLIDFDSQASLTYSLGIDPDEVLSTVYELFKLVAEDDRALNKDRLRKEFLIPIKHNKLYLLPASPNIAGLEHELDSHPCRDYLFKKVMSHTENFDFVLIDCAPNLGTLTINALAAVKEVFAPVETEFLALQGFTSFTRALEVLVKALNPELKLSGVIATKYNHRKLHKDTIGFLKEHFPDILFNTFIRDNIALAEAPSFGKDVFTHSNKSSGAQDYMNLCKEIISR